MGKITAISSDTEDNIPLAQSLKELNKPTHATSAEHQLPKLEYPSASRIVTAGPTLGADGKPHYLIDDIPDQEKLRLIRESGLMNNMRKYNKTKTSNGSDNEDSQEEEDDEGVAYGKEEGEEEAEVPKWMDAVIYSFGLMAIYGLFEALVNQQYNVEVGMKEIVARMGKALPAIWFIVYLTHRYRHQRAVALLMLLAACASGCYFVYLNLHSPRLGIMRRAPGLVTMWIYLTFQMDVRPSIISALVVCSFWIIDPFKLDF
ncbi:hypothetical protein LPJ66_006573 [Kickxella alabastrina]|uniref:Uncharacterized protein n=1 Tax=Kickxella alabastrina TaxID=61397 RepID=A0ACC1IBC1_9FUNG|nr:hypothetical protein LPJ66_006573 [Kickxella alabastrina]